MRKRKMKNHQNLREAVIILDKSQLEIILSRLREMRLPEMANELITMNLSGELQTFTVEEVLDRITSSELISRKNNTIARYKKAAKLSQRDADLSLIDYRPERKLNEAVIKQLSDDMYIRNHRNVIIMGACGTGKSFLANALASNACKLLHTTLYCRLFEILSDTNIDRISSGDTRRSILKYSKPEVLVIDDFLNTKLTENECSDLFKIIEYRSQTKSTIIVSQLDPQEWHKNLGGSILADSILDRLTAKSYKLVLSGESLRQEK